MRTDIIQHDAPSPVSSNAETKISQSFKWFTRRRLFFLVIIFAALFYLQFRLWEVPVRGDRANWDYFAQVIARGGIPYRDVVNIKSPLSAYIGAAAIVVTKPFGLRDLYAIRLIFGLLLALTVGFTFLIAGDYFDSRRKGILAALILLAFSSFAGLNAGIQPKTPMILFGLISLWAVWKDKPFAAGLFGMLSALSWQPGLLFVGAAGLAFSRYLTNWRDGRVVRIIIGAAIPLLIMLLYFAVVGALRDFYMWSFDYNRTVYGPREMRSVSNTFQQIGAILQTHYRESRIYLLLAAIGFVVAVIQTIRHSKAGKSFLKSVKDNAPRHAILIAPLVYFLFCLIDLQGNADMIPLLPFAAMFAAYLIVWMIDTFFAYLSRYKTDGANRQAQRQQDNYAALAFVVVCLVVFVFNEKSALAMRRGYATVARQDAEIAKLVAYLEPGDKIFVQGRTEILVLSGLTNASKYFFLDRGKDTYLDKMEEGGFAGWFERLKAERPKIVALSRLKPVDHREDFRAWANEEYIAVEDRIFSYFVRKDAASQIPAANEPKKARDEDDDDIEN